MLQLIEPLAEEIGVIMPPSEKRWIMKEWRSRSAGNAR